jgi:urease accessory protein UreF
METNPEIVEGKSGPDIKTIREKLDAWRKETTACQEAMETCLEKAKAGLEETEAVAELQEIPNEEAAVETIGATGRSCIAQGTRLSETRQGQCCTRRPERTDIREETS